MTRSAAIPVTALFLILSGTLVTARTVVSDDARHAFISAENHGILAPGSERDFNFPRFEPQDTSAETQSEYAQNTTGTMAADPIDEIYPFSLYRLREAPWGWTLSIKQQEDVACAVLISPVYNTPQGKTVYALRSLEPIGNTNKAKIFWGARLLGAADGLFFLASSAQVQDPELGNVLRINIPRKAVYGYAEASVREYACEAGDIIRLRLYGLPYAYHMSKNSTYIVPLVRDTTNVNPVSTN